MATPASTSCPGLPVVPLDDTAIQQFIVDGFHVVKPSDLTRLTPAFHRAVIDQADAAVAAGIGLYPIVTLQYSSTTLYQVSYHIQ